MVSSVMKMPRKRRSYVLDERVINAIATLAAKSEMSANRYLEKLGWLHAQQAGIIPMDARPLGETRGGDRSKKDEDG